MTSAHPGIYTTLTDVTRWYSKDMSLQEEQNIAKIIATYGLSQHALEEMQGYFMVRISTIIICYNQQEYIVSAIESALSQTGPFAQEILISDDFSDDGTRRIVDFYSHKYPKIIKNISPPRNVGVSENYKRCFKEASGDFLAILEGDDYWISERKLADQAAFLNANEDATMVFSRIEAMNQVTGECFTYATQDKLPSLLTGQDIANNRDLNPIINLSSAMFRRDALGRLPEQLFYPRLSEISLAFYLDRIGRIGFIDQVMSIYRINPQGVWSGASAQSKLEQAIRIREIALKVARPDYSDAIRSNMMRKKDELKKMKRVESLGRD